jgi:hypothetical protein
LIVLLTLLLAGCGGGGGSGGGQIFGDLAYRTVWPTDQSARSQLVTVIDSGGQTFRQPVAIDAPATSLVVQGLPAGEYSLRAELKSLAGGQGATLGVAQATFVVAAQGAVVESDASRPPTGMSVQPGTIALPVEESRRLLPSASVGGKLAFFRPERVAWDGEGGVRVSTDGVVTGVTEGPGIARATLLPDQISGQSAITVVPPPPPVRTRWTVLVYMNAASDLFTFSTLNMNQMERVAGNPEVRFVVQWKQSQSQYSQSSFDGTRRYVVTPELTDRIGSRLVQDMGVGVDMGDWRTLRAFIEWGTVRYPSDRTVLVVWSHGNGWRRRPDEGMTRAVSYDDETGNAIQIWELRNALEGHRFDILAWDASLMQMLEVAYEVRDHAQLIAGSEESPPGEGYPYDRVFARFRDNPNATTEQLSKAFVDGMLENPIYGTRKITQSVIESARLPALALAASGYADAILNNLNVLRTIDFQRAGGAANWTQQGYGNLPAAYDDDPGTAANNPNPQSGDFVMATLEPRFMAALQVTSSGLGQATVQVRNDRGQWIPVANGLAGGSQVVPVAQVVSAVRIVHSGGGGPAAINEVRLLYSPIENARALAQSYSQTSTRFYRDLFDLTLRLEGPGVPADVVAAGAAARRAVQDAMVWEGNNANSPDSHGVSIDFTPSSRIGGSIIDYRRLKFAQDTSWDELLTAAP